MIDQSEPGLGEPSRSGSRGRLRAAALGLLALAALIVAVTLFNRDSDSGGAAEEGDSTVETSESAENTTDEEVTDETEPSSEPTDESTEPSTPAETEEMSDEDGVTLHPDDPLVLITSSGWNAATQSIEVVGSVQGVATETSTCTATASLGEIEQHATVAGTFDGQGTSCGLISISMSGQPSGSYTVDITFETDDGIATSEPVVVVIP